MANEQELTFSRLSSTVGRDVALFCMCAVYDLPYFSENDADTWGEYCESVESGDFLSGEKDVNAALLAGMPTQDRWATIWGDGYTEADYADVKNLQCSGMEELRFLAIAIIDQDLEKSVMNLKSPLVICPETRKAKQIVLENDDYPLRYPLFVPNGKEE